VHTKEKAFHAMSGRIEDPIAYSEGYGHISRTGKKAVTEWELVGSSVCALFLKPSKFSLPIGQPNVPLSLLRLKLLTGNKHQLRIHLAEHLGGWFVHFLYGIFRISRYFYHSTNPWGFGLFHDRTEYLPLAGNNSAQQSNIFTCIRSVVFRRHPRPFFF